MLPSLYSNIPLEAIDAWLDATYQGTSAPAFYSSVDVRVAHYKAAAVDTNLFPAGFNNIHPADLGNAAQLFKLQVEKTVPGAKRILLVPEEHTRNLWYLENISVLQQLLESAGFEITVATFLDDDPEYCGQSDRLVIRSATGNEVTLNCLHRIVQGIREGKDHFDLAILNNDLTAGIPTVFRLLDVPIAPAPEAGWHQRHKSDHFNYTHEILKKAGELFSFDPWLFQCEHRVVTDVDVTLDIDRNRLADEASMLFSQINQHYTRYNINEKPLIFLKSDSGTYGMGVMPIEDPQDIIDLNRKGRNKLNKGKGSQPIHRFILQEGVPSALTEDGMIAEPCMYQAGSSVLGGFYRQHSGKSGRDNLNSQGMQFSPFIWKEAHSSSLPRPLRSVCSVITKVAAYATGLELASIRRQKTGL